MVTYLSTLPEINDEEIHSLLTRELHSILYGEYVAGDAQFMDPLRGVVRGKTEGRGNTVTAPGKKATSLLNALLVMKPSYVSSPLGQQKSTSE